MNRKLVNGLLLVALASGGCGVFTSCKDTNEDFYNKVVAGQVDLDKQLEKLLADLNDYATKNDLSDAKKELVDKITTEIGKLKDVYATKEELKDYLKTGELNDKLKDYLVANKYVTEDQLADYATKEELKDYLKEADLKGKLDELGVVYESEINTYIDNYLNQEGGVFERLKGVEDAINDEETGLAALAGQIKAINDILGTEENPGLIQQVQGLDDLLNGENGIVDKVSKLVDDVALNQADIDDLYQLMRDHKTEFEVLKNQFAYYINSINNRLDNTITDIVLNQAWNPMFGTINLPVGLSTTIAANYYGKSDVDLNFPFGAAAQDVLQGYETLVESGAVDKLLQNLKGDQAVITAGKFYMDTVDIDGEEYGKLGQLYLTINPNTANIAGTKFELVTSSEGSTVPIKVVVSPTDEELKFGVNVTRSAANGFYRADLYIKPEDATKITIDIEKGLKSAMKDAIVNHTKSDFVQLGKLIMDQMKDFLPAYGVKATWWTDNTTFLPSAWDAQDAMEHNFYGKYEVAATAIRPLSYEFMQGTGAHKDLLPTVGSLKDAFDRVFNEFDFTINTGITGFDAPTFSIDLSKAKLEFKPTSIVINLDGMVAGDQEITFNGKKEIVLTYTGEGVNKVVDPNNVNDGALDELINEIAKQVNNMLAGTDAAGNLDPNSIQGQIQDGIISKVDEMVTSINNQLTNVNANIQKSVDKIINDIKTNLLGKLGRVDNLVDKYNALANRINNLLKDPNHYLQVMMAYETAEGSLGELSSDVNYPTIFKKAGGDAIELFATSYTAELIAPSYKKYVAVSRAWLGTTAVDVESVNADNEFLNKVLPGRQQRVAIDANTLEPGVKYEIVYSSLDYRGYTSTRLFYITVAE